MSVIIPLASCYELDTEIKYSINNANNNCLSLDTFEKDVNEYGSLFFWLLYRNFPGRYEPFFNVKDLHKYGQCAWGLGSADFNDDGLLDFAIIWREDGSFDGGISIFINNGRNRFSESLISTIEDLHLDPDDSTLSVPISDLDAADYDDD
ncbi:unnamed protein product, partial [marine sediment metagenome]